MPTDIKAFLDNTTPRVNFNEVSGPSKPLTQDNVNQLGDDVYLTSNDDVTKNPAWIKGTKPDTDGKTNSAVTTAVIVNDKGDGNVDAFYMYFYANNYGGEVLRWSALNFGTCMPFLLQTSSSQSAQATTSVTGNTPWCASPTAPHKQFGTLNTPTVKPLPTRLSRRPLMDDPLPTPPKARMQTTPFQGLTTTPFLTSICLVVYSRTIPIKARTGTLRCPRTFIASTLAQIALRRMTTLRRQDGCTSRADGGIRSTRRVICDRSSCLDRQSLCRARPDPQISS
jgi:hypothetical protein